ncbi:MAG: hypothetical protein ACI93N_000038 [Flavobacteriaceae bacterium]|jgi:hypothetical protein
MTDKLFSKIVDHQANLKKHLTDIVYINETFNTKFGLSNVGVKNTNSNKKLPKYKYFKTIQLGDIIILRANFDANNKTHQYWCKKIHRFLEFRMSSIEDCIKANYANKTDRINFIQNVITLLLEYYDDTNDSRFLSTALKLLRNGSIVKYGFLNKKYNTQYSYNILAAHNLINNL